MAPGDTAIFTPYLPRLVVGWQCEEPNLSVRPLAGSMLFADVSGFTKMSERLARSGKVGAEEVTEVLNSTFARLLAVAYENGGGLLKFGGDALLLFFRGREHAARACHAAFGMRRKMREIGRIKTSAGMVQLRMSIGVHSGIFNFFLAGQSHRELIVAGPSASVTVEMEHAANAGEILISEATAASIDGSLLGEPRAGGYLLKRSPQTPNVAGIDPVPDTAGVDLSGFVPRAVRDYLATGSSEGEHRRIVVAFVRFSSLDTLLSKDHPLDVAGMLEEIVVAAQKAVEEHEITFLGSDIDADGGKIILLAGAPQAFDNDEERMLRAVRQIADAGCAIPLQIGVNRGHAFVGDVGPPYRRTYTVIGDVVNLAARVMAKAAPGEVLVTEEMLTRSRTVFETQALEPFMVKGKSKPVIAFRLGAVRGVRHEDAGQLVLPLIGRDIEMDLLLGALRDAEHGTGRVVEITGESGVGKSRLIEELRASSTEARTIVTAAEQYESGTPYFAFRGLIRAVAGIEPGASSDTAGEMLTAYVGEHMPALAPWLPFLAIPAGATVAATPEAEAIASEFRSARMQRTVRAFLAEALCDPTILVFDDAHWMDDASADVLRSILPVVDEHPWLLCVIRREVSTGFTFGEDTQRILIPLDPLSEQAAVALAGKAAEGVLLPAQIETVAQRSGGHPLFLRELVAAAVGAGSIDELPETVESVITARIDQLSPSDRVLLRQAAVLGATFSPDLLRDVTASPEAVEERVWRRLGEFVEPTGDGTLRFRQALYRDVAYEELPFRRRRELHRLAGETIEARAAGRIEEAAEILSLHFSRAQAHEKAWWYSRIAGEQAKTKYANVQAAAFFRRALESSRIAKDVEASALAEVWEALGDVSELGAEYGEAATAYRNARRVAGRHRLPALMLKEGWVRERLGQYSQALRWFSRGRSISETLDDTTEERINRVRLDLAIAVARHRQGRFGASLQMSKRAAQEAEKVGARSELARAYFIIGSTLTNTGGRDAAQYAELAVPIYEELGDLLGEANAVESVGIIRYWEGRWSESLACYRRSGELRERAGHVTYAALSRVNAAEILSDQGHLEEAEELFADARSVWRAAGYPLGVAVATSNLARVFARAGRFDEAAESYEEALTGFAAIGAESPVVETQTRIAELAMLRGEGELAVAQATEILERVADRPDVAVTRAMLHRIQGIGLLQQGDGVLAQDALDESLHIARKTGARYEVALTLRAWAMMARATGRDTSADKRGQEADAIFAELGVAVVPTIPLPPAV